MTVVVACAAGRRSTRANLVRLGRVTVERHRAALPDWTEDHVELEREPRLKPRLDGRTDVPCVRAAVQSGRRCGQIPSVSASLG